MHDPIPPLFWQWLHTPQAQERAKLWPELAPYRATIIGHISATYTAEQKAQFLRGPTAAAFLDALAPNIDQWFGRSPDPHDCALQLAHNIDWSQDYDAPCWAEQRGAIAGRVLRAFVSNGADTEALLFMRRVPSITLRRPLAFVHHLLIGRTPQAAAFALGDARTGTGAGLISAAALARHVQENSGGHYVWTHTHAAMLALLWMRGLSPKGPMRDVDGPCAGTISAHARLQFLTTIPDPYTAPITVGVFDSILPAPVEVLP